MSKNKDDFKAHKLCKGCKYDCVVIHSANLQMCKAIREDDAVAKRSRELSKEYERRKVSNN